MSSGGKKKKGMPHAHGSEVNVTPLIDVVMCLIIFFMLVAKIGVNTGAKAMDLPFSYLGKKIDDMGNTLTLNGTVVPFSSLRRGLRAMTIRDGNAAADTVQAFTK